MARKTLGLIVAGAFFAATAAGASTVQIAEPEPIKGRFGIVHNKDLIRYVDLILNRDRFGPRDHIDTYLGGKAGHLTQINPSETERKRRAVTWANKQRHCDCANKKSRPTEYWYTSTTTKTIDPTTDPNPSAVWIGPTILHTLTGLLAFAGLSVMRRRAAT